MALKDYSFWLYNTSLLFSILILACYTTYGQKCPSSINIFFNNIQWLPII